MVLTELAIWGLSIYCCPGNAPAVGDRAAVGEGAAVLVGSVMGVLCVTVGAIDEVLVEAGEGSASAMI